MKIYNKIIIFSLITILFYNSFSIISVSANNIISPDLSTKMLDQSNAFTDKVGFSRDNSVGNTAKIIISGFLSLLAIIFLVLIIVAGYNWMTAAGDESKVTYAKDTIKRAVIGIIIVVGAYAITAFVFQRLPMGNGNQTSTAGNSWGW